MKKIHKIDNAFLDYAKDVIQDPEYTGGLMSDQRDQIEQLVLAQLKSEGVVDAACMREIVNDESKIEILCDRLANGGIIILNAKLGQRAKLVSGINYILHILHISSEQIDSAVKKIQAAIQALNFDILADILSSSMSVPDKIRLLKNMGVPTEF